MKSVLGLIMAFDKPFDLRDIANDRAVASVPFGGRYRVIDFMLSNMVNAGIHEVGVVLQNNYQSLIDHIGMGKDWDLSRKIGGIRLLPPFSYSPKKNVFSVTERNDKIDGLIGVLPFIAKTKCEYVVLTDGNIVGNIDIEAAVKAHKDSQADVTCISTVKNDEDEHDTFFEVDKLGYISKVCASVDIDGTCTHTSLGVYILKKDLLEHLIASWASQNVKSFEHEGLLEMAKQYKMKVFTHDTFSAKITDIKRYYDANMSLLDQEVRKQLFIKKRPILTKVYDEQPTYYGDKSSVRECLIADGCYLAGDVENCIIFRDVCIKEGAVVKNSIILSRGTIEKNANVCHVLADKSVTIGENKTMMGHENYPIVIAEGSII